MSTITFSGLATGMDTASMVEQLVAAEKAPATALATKQQHVTSQKNIISSLSSALSSLTSAVKGLDLDSEINTQTASVSDNKVGVAVSTGATTGPHSFRVVSLAAAQVTQSKAFSSSAAGAAGAGTLDVTVAGTTKPISWTASDSLADIAAKINAAEAGVKASVVKIDDSSYRLVVTAKDTGTAKAPTFSDGGALGLAELSNIKKPASNALVNIDGIDITRSTNTISDALTGVTLTLKDTHKAADSDTTAQVTLDQAALKSKMEKVVDAFNLVNTQLQTQLAYTGTTKSGATLFGDSTLRGMQSALASVASDKYGNDMLASLGITRDKTGRMTLDATKLQTAVETDPEIVTRMFVTNGFAAAMTTTTERYTTAGGILSAKTDALTARSKLYQEQIDRVNKHADELQTRLERQFNAMERAISNMKAQSNSLASMLSSFQTT